LQHRADAIRGAHNTVVTVVNTVVMVVLLGRGCVDSPLWVQVTTGTGTGIPVVEKRKAVELNWSAAC
jgi:hypothetical protein